MWDFAFDGGAVEMFNNTVSGEVGFMGGYEWGVADMSGHGEMAASGVEHVGHSGVDSVGGADAHVGHCTMDTHGAAFDVWSEEEHGGLLSGIVGDQPVVSEQWSQFSDLFCPR